MLAISYIVCVWEWVVVCWIVGSLPTEKWPGCPIRFTSIGSLLCDLALNKLTTGMMSLQKSYTYKRARDLTVGDELIMENHGFVTEREEDSSLIKLNQIKIESWIYPQAVNIIKTKKNVLVKYFVYRSSSLQKLRR